MSSAIAMGKRSLTWSVVVATIAWSMGLSLLVAPLAARAQAGLAAGTLIKASLPAVYYYGSDGKRYVFPNEKAYKTWYSDFSGVQTVSDATLASIAIGGNATYRPGVKMVKITTDPKVYAVDRGGSLRHVATEAVALALYGASWAGMVEDVPDAFFVNYTLGSAVNAATDFSVAGATTAATSISADKSLAGGTTAPTAPAGPQVITAMDGGSPANATIPYNATDVIFAKLKLSGTGTLTGLKVTRTGLARDADLTAIKIYDGTTQLGTSQTLNAAHQATFTGLNVAVGGDKVLSVAGDIANVNAGDIVQLGVEAAGDITLASGSAGGTFPIRGGQMTISAVTIGAATLFRGADMPTADTQINPDQADFRFTQVRIQAGANEDLTVRQIVAIQSGTVTAADVKDIKLVNDTAGAEVAKVATMASNGRVVFDGLNIPVKKGETVNLSVKATMAGGSSSGRTVGFEFHDGVAYTVRIVGNTFGFGITAARNDFCSTAGVAGGACQVQTVAQGTLRATRSANSPSTGNIAQGGTQVPLLSVDLTASGEDVRVTSQNWDFAFADDFACTELTSLTLYDKNGAVVAGPQDCSGGTLTFTDSMTVPVGTSAYMMKGNVASTAGDDADGTADTVTATLDVDQFTVRGVQSGKTTTVQTTTDIAGNALTVQRGALGITNQATPIAGNVVRNVKNYTFLKTTLDASSGGEDAKVTSVTALDTIAGAGARADVANLELWGDPDTSDATDVVQRLETTNATSDLTASGANGTVAFTLKSPLRIAKGKISVIQIRGDVTSTATLAGTHTFSVDTAARVTTSGWTTGSTITPGTPSGAGQTQTIRASGSLRVELASDRPSAGPIVAGSTGVSTMKYKLTAVDENIDLTELPLAFTGNVANVSRVKLYKEAAQIGAGSGNTFNADGFVRIVLDSGSLVLTK
ncbi:MAG: hypothetical protein Q7S02_01030, partial [bacterium]|nr:hypothetical protein [bacterium]